MDAPTVERQELSPKELRWEQTIKQIAEIEQKDPHGLKIDQKIKSTVIGLNALGISTTMSCEGHIDHGIAAPYIRVASAEARQIARNASDAYRLQRHADYERLRQREKELNEKVVEEVKSYLSEFYLARQVPDHVKLSIEITSFGSMTLKSNGAATQNETPLDQRSTNLAAYQEEMEDFGKFLEYKFFSQ